MALIRSKTKNPAEKLRFAVDAMPGFAKEAMLRGMDENTIIAGSYTDPDSGGICPMLAAHRNGGRISLSSFARCWDLYTDARRPRVCTERELRTLRGYLEMSLAREGTHEGSLRDAAGRIRHERAEISATAKAFEFDLDTENAFDFGGATDPVTAEELAAMAYDSTPDEEGRYSADQLLAPDPRAARRRSERPIRSTVDRPLLQDVDPDSLYRSDERREGDRGAWMRPTRSWSDYRDDVAAAAEQISEIEAERLTRRERVGV